MTRIFRKKSAALTLAVLCFLLIGKVTAEPLSPKVSEPTSYKDFLFGVNEVRENIETVQCGGWLNTDASVAGSSVSGSVPIPTIEGVPGRENIDPLGAPTVGLGVRGDFEYPDGPSTTGFMTACDIHEFEIINPERLCIKDENTATPENCRKLYDRLTQELPQMVADGTFPSGAPSSVTCQTVRPGAPGSPPVVQTHYCFQYSSECEGEECRTPNPPEFRCQGAFVTANQSSFYRHYDATVTTPDSQRWDIEAICYEQYKEFDPKDTVTDVKDEQCEIILPQGQDPEWDDGSGKQKETVRLPPEETDEPDSPDREAKHPWLNDTESNLTIVDYYEWQKEAEGDARAMPQLSDALAIPVQSKARASKTNPPNAKTDTFDDTAERDFASFWEAEQRELLAITRDPELTLILPARFLHGLADSDPLFEMVKQLTTLPSGLVELTLRAGKEDLGRVLQSFAESKLFHFEEVRVPVPVPVAGDIDARIADWKEWQAHESRAAQAAGRASYADLANPIIEKLIVYKEVNDRVRALRGFLLTYTAELFESDKKMRQEMLDWYTANVDVLLQVDDENEARRAVQRVWKRIQRALLITDECQLLWCSNQRYSAPVYSLLDGWWGDTPAGSSRNFSYAPESVRSLGLPAAENIVVDFSTVSFPQESIRIPVLWPVQIRVNLPTPPRVGESPSLTNLLPDIPEIPNDIDIRLYFPVPTVGELDLPVIESPEGPTVPELETAADILRDLRQRIDGTPYETQLFEESQDAMGIPPMDPEPLEYTERNSMQNAICRFPYSTTLERPSNTESSKEMIIHVESDLHERTGRLFARWMPNRTEDFAGRVARLNEEPDTSTCNEGLLCWLLPDREISTYSFQWVVPDENVRSEDFVRTIKNRTLPRNDEENPYYLTPLSILERLFPDVALPIRVILTPDA